MVADAVKELGNGAETEIKPGEIEKTVKDAVKAAVKDAMRDAVREMVVEPEAALAEAKGK